MDWTTVLLVLAFIVIPIIQEALKSRKAPPPSDVPPPDDRASGEGSMGSVRQLPAGVRTTPDAVGEPADDGWSDNWGSWPGASDAPRLPEIPGPNPSWRRPTSSYQPLPQQPEFEVLIDDAPSRLEELAASLNHLAEVERTPHPHGPIRIAPPILTRRIAAPARRRENLRLNSTQDLRRAVILNEILGPPRSLQPLEGGR